MLNYYCWYAIIWGAVLVLYILDFSSINTVLTPEIVLFFLSTIVISYGWGILNRDKIIFYMCPLKYRRYDDLFICALLIFYFLFEFFRFGGIPMLEYFTGKAVYTNFKGTKTWFPLIVTFTVFYSIYLFYMYISLCKIKKRFLIEALLLSIVLLGAGLRGTFISNIFAMILIVLSYSKLSIKKLVLYFCFLIVLLYIFGVVGNLRSGASWNDDSLISFIGGYGDAWPQFLPNVFKWAYTYITSPLNNLNYNFFNNIHYDWLHFFEAFFPDFLAKRLFSEYAISGGAALVVEQLTVSTGYISACLRGGLIGMYVMFIGQFLILGFVLKVIKAGAYHLYIPALALANNIVIFFFFENTVAHSGFILPLLYPFAYAIVKLCKKRR